MSRPEFKRDVLLAILCLVAYLAAAMWAKEFSLPGSILIWFPPAGVAIGFCYLQPRLVVVVAIAEVLSTTFIMQMAGEFGVVGLLANSVGIAGSYWLAGVAMRRLELNPRLRTAEDVLLLAGACLVIGSVPAALIGVAVQARVGLVAWSDFGRSASIFWLGDAIGAICTAPVVVLVGGAALAKAKLPFSDEEPGRLGRLVLVVEYATPAIVGLVLLSLSDNPMRFAYLAFVPVVLLAVRHGIAGAVFSSVALAAIMTVGAHIQLVGSVERSDFQLLILTLSLTGLIVGAVVSARRDALTAKSRLGEIVEATTDLVVSATRAGSVTYLNPAGRRMIGLGPVDLEGLSAFDYMADELSRELMREGMRKAERDGSWSGENRLKRTDGTVIPVSQVLIAHEHPGDEDVSFSSVCRDVSDAQRIENQLRRATLYDDSTGLPNRALLTEQLERLAQSDMWGTPTAVLFCDTDGLDQINETWGFVAGDQMLATIGQRVRDTVRRGDLVARYGGAQFVVVMAGTDDEVEPVHLADRLVACFGEPITVEGHSLRITGSVGISLVEPGQSPQDAMRCAEIALHRAREAGGGCSMIFDQNLQERTRQRIEIAADLQHVLDTESWWLEYQPIVEVDSRTVVGAEALLRWSHPERGPVSPFDLIRRAEHSGVIVELGHEILCRACAEAQRWHDHGFAMGVSVNVSARQLREPDFVSGVTEVLTSTGLAASALTLELTETVIATDQHGATGKLQELRDLGCKVSLDDFGTGYSSLGELLELPIDGVKLDMAFIRLLDESPRAASMVDTIVRLGSALDLTVIAEGVERESQAAMLSSLGCPWFQGFVFSKSITGDAFEELLRHPAGSA